MARRFLDDIKNDLNALLVTAGNTTAPQLNALLIDMIDSTIQDETVIFNDQLQTGVIVGDDEFVKIGGFTGTVGGDDDFLKPDITQDEIITSATAGFTYNISAKVAFTGRNNRRHDFAIFMNGSPTGFVASATGDGSAKFLTADVAAVVLSAPANAVFDIRASADDPDPLDISSIALSVVIHATNNA